MSWGIAWVSVVGLLLALEVDLLKPAKSFAKLLNRLFICKVKSDSDCSSFAAYKDRDRAQA